LDSVPASGAPMDLPYAERVLHLDFVSIDFAATVPGDLS
jgi:hypothetical protein